MTKTGVKQLAEAEARAGGWTSSQHVDGWRKIGLRRDLIAAHAVAGAAYVPFLGEADIALELYTDRRIVGIELDAAIADRAEARLTANLPKRADGTWSAIVITGDANTWQEAAAIAEPYAIADLDSYSNPYQALEAFWQNAPKADTVVVFGTDGLKMPMLLHRSIAELPSGKLVPSDDRGRMKFWWIRHVRPWLESAVAPARIVADSKYLRAGMLYWGIVVDRSPAELEQKSGPSAARRSGLKRATTEHYRGQVAKRVAKRAAHTPKITKAQRLEILERDGWTCQLCRKPIDPAVKHPDRNSPSVDHIRAAQAGGAHDPSNFQAAHLGCNAAKRDNDANIVAVETALLEAARSGSVPAAIFWLEHRGGPTWQKKAASDAAELLTPLRARRR